MDLVLRHAEPVGGNLRGAYRNGSRRQDSCFDQKGAFVGASESPALSPPGTFSEFNRVLECELDHTCSWRTGIEYLGSRYSNIGLPATMVETVSLAPPSLLFDVTRVASLRKRLGHAATALKIIGFGSAIFLGFYLSD